MSIDQLLFKVQSKLFRHTTGKKLLLTYAQQIRSKVHPSPSKNGVKVTKISHFVFDTQLPDDRKHVTPLT
jgi:hypothetical protein